MDITSTNPFGPNAGAAQSAARFADTFDTFLTILTEQLRHQDPLEPLDANEFTAQLVQFTEVEQSIAGNNKLDALIQLQQINGTTAALGYIGKRVEIDSDAGKLEQGQASWSYTLPKNAKAVAVNIVDATGKTVRTIEGETAAGTHPIAWDGKDNLGQIMPDGFYALKIAATDAADQSLSAKIRTTGLVTGVINGDDGLRLTVNGKELPVTAILAVKDAGQS